MTAVVALLSVQQAAAGALSFSLKDGRVTILAYSVTVREILNEWERFGRVSIVGSDALGATPITLELRDVPEAKALDVLLRSVSGYVAVSRNQPVAIGSIFQTIRILPTSRAPIVQPPVTAQAPAPRMPGPAAFVPPGPTLTTTAVAPGVPTVLRPPPVYASGAVERVEQVPGSNPAAGDAAHRFAPLTPLEQAGLRQNQQALQEFLARTRAGNTAAAATSGSAPAVSTDASRPGSITPYTPPSNQRPVVPPN
jgi:hypothetical protein